MAKSLELLGLQGLFAGGEFFFARLEVGIQAVADDLKTAHELNGEHLFEIENETRSAEGERDEQDCDGEQVELTEDVALGGHVVWATVILDVG